MQLIENIHKVNIGNVEEVISKKKPTLLIVFSNTICQSPFDGLLWLVNMNKK